MVIILIVWDILYAYIDPRIKSQICREVLDVPNDNLQPDTVKKDRRNRAVRLRYMKRFPKNKLAMVGFVIIVNAVLLAAFASVICDHEADAITQNYDARFLGPPPAPFVLNTIMAATFLPVCFQIVSLTVV